MSGMCTKTVISPKLTVVFKIVIHQMKAYLYLYLQTEVTKSMKCELKKCELLTYFSIFIFLTEISC